MVVNFLLHGFGGCSFRRRPALSSIASETQAEENEGKLAVLHAHVLAGTDTHQQPFSPLPCIFLFLSLEQYMLFLFNVLFFISSCFFIFI